MSASTQSAKPGGIAIAPSHSKPLVPLARQSLSKREARRQRMLQTAVTAGLAGTSAALGSFSISAQSHPLPESPVLRSGPQTALSAAR
jgi:hypothetical protein